MQIAIRTRRFSLSTRLRSLIERYLRLALSREPFRVSAATLYLRPAHGYGSDVEITAKLVARTPQFPQITISDSDTKLGRLLVRVARRARYLGRSRLKRKVHLGRRTGNRFSVLVLDEP